ncbi:MAG: GNAT family N-acetyltransferase [Candidatus Babeliales bacterium]
MKLFNVNKFLYTLIAFFITTISNSLYSMEQIEPIEPETHQKSQIDTQKSQSLIQFYPERQSYVISRDGQTLFSVTFAPNLGIDECLLNTAKGETVWQDPNPESDLEMTVSIPPAERDCGVLGQGLRAHNQECLGGFDLKIFIAALKDDAQNQICGAVGLIIFDNLLLVELGVINPELFPNFIQKIENFAIQNGAKRAQFKICEDGNMNLIDLFLSSGYVIKGQCLDLNEQTMPHRNLVCHMYKELDGIQEQNTTGFDTAWLPLNNKNQQQEICKNFFSPETKNFMQKFDIQDKYEKKPIQKIGVFIRDIDGEVVGGCLGSIKLNISIPHIHINDVWIVKSLRGNGLSKIFLNIIENIAKEFGCIKSSLVTSDYHAPWLYRKVGYNAVIEFPYFGNDHKIWGHAAQYYTHYEFQKDL